MEQFIIEFPFNETSVLAGLPKLGGYCWRRLNKKHMVHTIIGVTENALSQLIINDPTPGCTCTVTVKHTIFDGLTSDDPIMRVTLNQLVGALQSLKAAAAAPAAAEATSAAAPSTSAALAYSTTVLNGIYLVNHLTEKLYQQRRATKVRLSKRLHIEMNVSMIKEIKVTSGSIVHTSTDTSSLQHRVAM